MQQYKGIQNISEMADLVTDNSHVLDVLRWVLDRFNMSAITKELNSVKSRGINASILFRVLFMFPFLSINNIRCLFSSGLSEEVVRKKDCYYRFLNDPNIAWRKIVRYFSNQFFKQAKIYGNQDSSNETRCLIVDDSFIPKSGKKIEFVGKVFDHCSHYYLLGLKLLLLGYWDGKNFVPLNFSLHYEPGKKINRGLTQKELDKQFTKERPDGCPSKKRIDELGKSKIDVALEFIREVKLSGLSIDYVLADSWFVSAKFIMEIMNMKLNMIGLMKSN